MASPSLLPIPSSSRSPSSYSVSSDDSNGPELSFDYTLIDGDYVRTKRDVDTSDSPKSRSASPPKELDPPKKPTVTANAVAALGSAVRRLSLSRSESVPVDILASSMQHRTLQRVNSSAFDSLAALTPAPPLGRAIAPFSGGLRGTGRKIGGAQRIRREEAERQRREIEDRIKRETEEAEREAERIALEEKENNVDGHVEQRRSPPMNGARSMAALPVCGCCLRLRVG